MLGSILAGCVGGNYGSDCVPYQPNIHMDGEPRHQDIVYQVEYQTPVELAYLHYKDGCQRAGEIADWRIQLGPGAGWFNMTAPLEGFEFTPPHLGAYTVWVTAKDADGNRHGEKTLHWWAVRLQETRAMPGSGLEVQYPAACCLWWLNATVVGPLSGWRIEAYLDDQLIAADTDDLRRSRNFPGLGESYFGTIRIVATPPLPTTLEHSLAVDIQSTAIPPCLQRCT